jgi:putative transposase
MEKRISSAVYLINYHFVWCLKYRKPILIEGFGKTVEETIRTICLTKNWEILELKIMPDHIHLFLSSPPYNSPMGIIKVLKGVSAKHLYSVYPELRSIFRKGSIWSPSYYVGTAGNVASETILKYIQEQERRNSSSG